MPRTSRRRLNLGDLGRVTGVSLASGGGRFSTSPTAGIEWTPNRRVFRRLPAGYRLRFRLLTDSDGLRQIVPTISLQEFVLEAAVGGLAIMSRLHGMSAEHRYTYRFMSLIHQWSHSSRRTLNRKFSRAEDLNLRMCERTAESEASILPQLLTECAEPWGVSRFLSTGLGAARLAGHSSPSIDIQVAYALLEIAGDMPAITDSLSPPESDRIIRYSLFGSNQGDSLPEGTDGSEIEEALLPIVHKKLAQSAEKFDQWLYGDFDNLLQQLARRQLTTRVNRQQVRRALYDLLWRSFRYLSDCVCLQMQAVRLALTPRLTSEERRVFGIWYEAQDWLAGLVPVMLSISTNLLLPTLQTSESIPERDGARWRNYLQALLWRREMVENRRRADSNKKQSRSRMSTCSANFDWNAIPQEMDENDEED